MTKPAEPIALVDMDGTLVNFDGQMGIDLLGLASPEDPDIARGTQGPGDEKEPGWLRARKALIKRQPGWWLNLPRHEPGFDILHLLRKLYFDIHILTKGPWSNAPAWAEKHEWVRTHLKDVSLHQSEDKGLVYGKILVDDWPPYVERWLEWRPRGLVIMPAWPWNEGHPVLGSRNVIRYESRDQLHQIEQRLWEVRKTATYAENDQPECTRVSGDVECETCGLTYREHPYDLAALDFVNRMPYLRIGCDGRRLKL